MTEFMEGVLIGALMGTVGTLLGLLIIEYALTF